jgi:hypothetical protein
MPEIIKSHPYISIGALLASVAVVFYVSAGGGSGGGAVVTSDPNAVAAGVALQQSQMQQQTQMAGISASLAGAQNQNATQIALADITGKYAYDTSVLAAGVRTQEISAMTQTEQLKSTLQAQSEMAQIKATTDQASINSATTIATIKAVSAASENMAWYQYQLGARAIDAGNQGGGCSGIFCF